MRIGIITLPFNTNYGGMLQSYALYTILKKQGYDVTILAKKGSFPLLSFKEYLKFGILYLLGKTKFNPIRHILIHYNYDKVCKFTYRFLEDNTTILYFSDYAKEIRSNDYDAFVVGSDQVWRPQYFGDKIIEQAFLNFTVGWNVKRISFAASFGTNRNEYSDLNKKICSKSLKLFDAISCREDGGVVLCREIFGVDAIRIIDPTMLLNKEDYITICPQSRIDHNEGKIFSYVLDNNLSINQVEDVLSNCLGLEIFHVNAMTDNKLIPIQQHIYHWLQAFQDAEMIITDSFHGTILSIIFNKPFWIIGNEARGLDRFDSLLKIYGLTHRLINPSDISNVNWKDQIDWSSINNIRNAEKQKAIDFLNNSLK